MWRNVSFSSMSTEQEQSQVWFGKILALINHVRKISKLLLVRPGLTVSIDEMMVRCSGRSVETHRMKHKPIDQGYKCFAVTDSKTGFVCHFTPDGRVAGNDGLNEYSRANQDGGKLHHMLMYLYEQALSSHRDAGFEFVIFHDNYFTYPRTIQAFREKGVAVTGTARGKRGWPPNVLKVPENHLYNDLYYCVDDFNNLVLKWVDNNVVLMVTTAHNPSDFVEKVRRRSRLTDTNKNHVQSVWGSQSTMAIEIPRVIDDYNCNMGGVDVCDQRIASYAAGLRCRRTWMPFLLQCLHFARNNAYVVYREKNTNPQSQKDFVMDLLRESIRRVNVMKAGSRMELRNNPSQTGIPARALKRFRTSKNHPILPEKRLDEPRELHTKVIFPQLRVCRFCSYLRAKSALDQGLPVKVRRSTRGCSHCEVHLCAHHFDEYHDQ